VHVLELVRPVRVHRRHLREEAAFAAVRAAVEDEARTAREQGPIGSGARLELDHHALAAMSDGDELLATREHELHRPACRARERGDVAFEVEVAFRAEPSSEQGHDHADSGFRDAEHVRDAGARDVGDLCRRPDGHLVALPLRDDRPRLDRDALHRVGHVATADDHVRVGEGCVDVALDDRRVAEQVAAAAQRLVAIVRLPLRVNEGRPVVERRLEVTDDGEGLEVDLDESRGLPGDLG
jgi:hypothetical protein